MLEFNDLEAFAFLVGGREVVGNHIFRGANLFFTVDVRLLRHCMIPEAPNVSPPQSCRWQKNYALTTLN